MKNVDYSQITIEPAQPIEGLDNEHAAVAQNVQIDIEPPADFMASEQGGQAISASASAAVAIATGGAKTKSHMGMKAKTTVANVIIYVILGIMTVVWLFPFVGIFFESFRTESAGLAGYIMPRKWGFDNYIKLFSDSEMNFTRWFLNTAIMGIFVSVFQTIFVLSMSYVLSRMRFKGRKFLMNMMLILGMFPGFLTLILLYKVLSDFNLTNENAIWGLILVYVASSGMGYYVSKGFFDTIPKSLDEAARVDGATRSLVFFKIIMPMAKPIIIYTILMGFMAPWGDFMLARFISHNTDSGRNVAVGMQYMIDKNSIGTKWTQFCAGGVVVSIPITVLFMCLQKYYVEGVTGGAVKG